MAVRAEDLLRGRSGLSRKRGHKENPWESSIPQLTYEPHGINECQLIKALLGRQKNSPEQQIQKELLEAYAHRSGRGRRSVDMILTSQKITKPSIRVAIGATLDPLFSARQRGEQMKRDILATQGELFNPDQVAARLEIDPAIVAARCNQGELLGLPLDNGRVGLPAWQFTAAGILPGLEDVLRELGVHNVWMRAAFFLSGDLRLNGRTPLEALINGEVAAAQSAAAAYGEQLAS